MLDGNDEIHIEHAQVPMQVESACPYTLTSKIDLYHCRHKEHIASTYTTSLKELGCYSTGACLVEYLVRSDPFLQSCLACLELGYAKRELSVSFAKNNSCEILYACQH